MNSYSPVSQSGASIPDSINHLGGDYHDRVAQAERARRGVERARQVVTVTDLLVTARDEAQTAERTFDEARARMASTRQRVAELEVALSEAHTALGIIGPVAAPAPIVHGPAEIGPTYSQAVASVTSSADQLARAYGFSDARGQTTAQLLNSLDAPTRAAIEADEAALAVAVDLALAGKPDEALTAARAVTAPKTKGK